MMLTIFAVGIFVFLITVYGTVVAGGLMLTGRQLDDDPTLAPDVLESDDLTVSAARTRAIVNAEF